MALSTKPYKGARDFYPEDKRLQVYMFSKLRAAVEAFGYEEYDAPILESLELYAAKSGEEIVNEQTYAFTDRGGREVVIRPEMTPTVSRMVAAKRQELSYPLRWYSIPNLWRYEQPQRGRLREHWQLNVDIFGVETTHAELELIQVADSIYKLFGASPSMYEIRINDRRFMDEVLGNYLGLDEVQAHAVAKLIDRMNKLSPEAFSEQLHTICDQETAGKALQLLNTKTFADLPIELQECDQAEGVASVLVQLESLGIANARFDITLMRGFDYYTGVVFEVFDTDPENNRSMMGGGRYDGLVGLFGVAPVPTAGFGLGDATLANFLEKHDLVPQLSSATQVYVALAGPVLADVQPLLAALRAGGVNVSVDISGRKLGDQIKHFDKQGARQVLIVGAEELAANLYVLRDLANGHEKQLTADSLIDQFGN